MTSKEKISCVIFSPKKSSDQIQGIRLRETVKQIALSRKPPIFGRIRNLSNGQVEMVCKTNAESLEEFLYTIETTVLQSTGIELTNNLFPADQLEKWMSFDTFNVEKSGQMEEMELAIRGAEFLFRRMYTQMVEFHREDQLNKLDGLEYDLLKYATLIEDTQSRNLSHQLTSVAIDSYLAQPFDTRLTRICREINQLYLDHKVKKGDSPFVDDELGNLTKLINQSLEIIAELKKTEKERDNKTKQEE